MRWDDLIFTGLRDDWHWVVVREMIRELPILATQFHVGNRLCISAFDSGPISPSQEETSLGWSLIGELMVSPPLAANTEIPCDGHDEWYIFSRMPNAIDIKHRCVNYFGFTLADPKQLAASQDPTWDRTKCDWLVPLQENFWRDIDRLNPVSYVSSGDYDIVVTKNHQFAESILTLANENKR
jgi:hypothetical protein